jgi:hypothetical protein
MTHYAIDDQHGTNSCGGLSEAQARRVAQECADTQNAPVLLYSSDGDEETIQPQTLGSLGRAGMLAALASAVGDDGTGDLGVIVDHARPADTVGDLVAVVREARADAALERSRG